MPTGRKMDEAGTKSKAVEEMPPKAGEFNPASLGKEFSALHEIRDRTLMLSLANAYLCEEAFLKKAGSAIESKLENLKQEIQSLKMRFPGKLIEEFNTDSMVEDLHAHAQRLQNPNKGLTDKCTIGTLGRELEETLGVLTAAVKKIKKRVEGETPAYTAKDSVLGVLGKAKTPASMAARLISLAVKTVFVLLLLSLGPLTYLGLTMDREGALLNEIEQSDAFIRIQREIIASSEREKEFLSQKIQSMQADDAPREIKLEIMEMNVKLHSLDQAIHGIEAEIAEHESRIKDRKQRVQEIREKSFLDRFLRR
jgi:hypothetical protein